MPVQLDRDDFDHPVGLDRWVQNDVCNAVAAGGKHGKYGVVADVKSDAGIPVDLRNRDSDNVLQRPSPHSWRPKAR